MYKVIKVSADEFTGQDGQTVKGQLVYLVNEGSGDTLRCFVAELRWASMQYKPKVGESVYAFRNQAGRVVDFVKA